jgi:hypothetical protein
MLLLQVESLIFTIGKRRQTNEGVVKLVGLYGTRHSGVSRALRPRAFLAGTSMERVDGARLSASLKSDDQQNKAASVGGLFRLVIPLHDQRRSPAAPG